ncbi:cytochrome C-552 [Falsiroseomonas sp.]|uniref:cytochrome C-552 n=1 Tax=Falsiroseomonas sp. TaxID=2870721 RepID=UPI0027346E9A|nr:cytochrome C-552 [Falsiroseomonas sp.]MDP3417789.1 cytochrome C-552 [Falsiroseomonas sp.]
MRKTLAFLLLLGGGVALTQMPGTQAPILRAAWAQSASLDAATQPAEEPSVLPAGEGQEEVFYACTACHSTAIIRRSRFSRERWDELMTWMTEVHGMNPLEGEERTLIVSYLAQHFGPAQAPARGRNPFLN